MGPPARLMYGYRPAYPAYRFGYSAYQNNFLTNTFDSKIRSNALSQDIIDKIRNDANNVCLTSLEEGLAGIETATQLVEKAGSLGGVKIGESIRKGKVFTERIVAELNKINNLDLGTLDCTRPGDFSVAAQTLEDLSVI